MKHTTRTLSGPPSTGAAIAMDGGVAVNHELNTTPVQEKAGQFLVMSPSLYSVYSNPNCSPIDLLPSCCASSSEAIVALPHALHTRSISLHTMNGRGEAACSK